MLRLPALLSIAAAAALGAACATTQPAAPDVSTGRAFLERACAGCHGIGLMDRSPNPHAPPLRHLALTRTDSELASALEEVSARGHVEMPPIYVTPQERREVLIYLHTLRGGVAPADPSATATPRSPEHRL